MNNNELMAAQDIDDTDGLIISLHSENMRLTEAIWKRDDLLNSVNEEANRYRAALATILPLAEKVASMPWRYREIVEIAQEALKGGE